MTDVKMDSGIESATTRVFLQVPRKRRIMAAVSSAAMMASLITPLSAARTNTDWSNSAVITSSGGRVVLTWGSTALMRSMMSRVDAEPLFKIVVRAPLLPFWRTMFVCGAKPSRTWATSRM